MVAAAAAVVQYPGPQVAPRSGPNRPLHPVPVVGSWVVLAEAPVGGAEVRMPPSMPPRGPAVVVRH